MKQKKQTIALTTLIILIAAVPGVEAQSSAPVPYTRPVEINRVFNAKMNQNRGLTFEELQKKHAKSYLGHLGFDVTRADYYKAFVKKFGLSAKAQAVMKKNGFVVVPSPIIPKNDSHNYDGRPLPVGPTDTFYRVFAADLPVYISADAILHAFHRMFDEILEAVEKDVLVEQMTDLVRSTIVSVEADTTLPAAQREDLIVYLATALCLLPHVDGWPSANTWACSRDFDEPIGAEVMRYNDLIETCTVQDFDFIGERRAMDFSMFIPRGHYADSGELQAYFRAMTWLSSMDLILFDPATGTMPEPRQEALARNLSAALVNAGTSDSLRSIERLYQRLVGPSVSIDPATLYSWITRGSRQTYTSIYTAIPTSPYSSRLEDTTGAEHEDDAVLTLRLLPKRFSIDAWMMTRTTTPRLEPAVQGGRAMAADLDVAFGLGAERALQWYGAEMADITRAGLPAVLESLYQTAEEYPPSRVADSVTNHWLNALVALSKAQDDPRLPGTLRTGAYHDRKLEAVLASWTELRHDTVLLIEQSGGGMGCQYPRGYVEPVPSFYRSLWQAVANLEKAVNQAIQNSGDKKDLFANWKNVLETLETMAIAEIEGRPFTEAQLTFLNETVDLHIDSYSGARMYNGWYPRLFYGENGEESKPIVTDLHTDVENGRVLHGATGHMGLMVIAIDNNGDKAVYAGPVYNYYGFEVDGYNRLTDDQWRAQLALKKNPAKPLFTRDYWVLDKPADFVPDKNSAPAPNPFAPEIAPGF
jgi:hypothetical protein